MMTDAQFGILIGVITSSMAGLVTVIKWSVTQLTKALDGNTKAHLDSVRAMTEMSTKLDFVYKATGRVQDFIKEEISGVHEVAEEKPLKIRVKTSPGER